MQGSNEVIPVKVGFRKIELKGDQILVNGKAVLFKGADRHEMDPELNANNGKNQRSYRRTFHSVSGKR